MTITSVNKMNLNATSSAKVPVAKADLFKKLQKLDESQVKALAKALPFGDKFCDDFARNFVDGFKREK